MSMRKNYFVAAVRMLLLILWIIVMPLIYFLAKLVGVKGYQNLPHVFHQGTCRILGIVVSKSGELSTARPTLYVSNHVSYIDVFVLGFIRAYFIAKSEVANWPFFGKMARFQNTLFFERKTGKAREQLNIMQTHLKSGNSLTLFPEGTSTDGVHVEPFKSSLFEAANLSASALNSEKAMQVAIQPITVAYTHYNGELITDQAVRDHYAWYAKMPFAPHFFGLFPLKKVSAKIHFHPVCYLEQFETRKQCADHCQRLVAEKLDELVADKSAA